MSLDFINVGGRHVSVRHIRAFALHPDDRDVNGRRISQIWIEGEAEPTNVAEVVYAGWVQKASLPVVPAAPGRVALAYGRTETGYEIQRSPILAWRTIHSFWDPWAEPVTYSPLGLQDAFDDLSIKAPDGTVWGTAKQSWPNEEAWAREKREEADKEEAFRRQLDAEDAAARE